MSRNLNDLIESTNNMIDYISEQELYDADMVLARELAEQLRDELLSLHDADDE